ncbi:hypothetical protein M33023_05820 [Candidatus Phytoplasma asteris]|uniref:Uncharacterized protein n=2 Tax=16SrI (Aster yellows group) TaxID=3042590 RepID=Q2NIR2_AYWBP|nr:hypothetical protein AYWB_564 [Aster yellows witches'-broom phytoplasma AYWB]
MQNPFNKWQKTLNKIDIFTQIQIIQDNNAIFCLFLTKILKLPLEKINKVIIMEYNSNQKNINSRQRDFFR